MLLETMPKDESSPSQSKTGRRWPWITKVLAATEAQELEGRRWVGRARKKFRVRANVALNQKVRKLIHELGYRYIVFDERLPGTPHLVFASRKVVIFTVSKAPELFRNGKPNPSSRSLEERAAWELLAVRQALTLRGWHCVILTTEDAKTKKSLYRKIGKLLPTS